MAPLKHLFLVALCTQIFTSDFATWGDCACHLFKASLKKGAQCDTELKRAEKSIENDGIGAYSNIPILTAVYCFNNGTGVCKVLAGRFEFYFNSWTQTYLGPVEASDYVDEYGYHERVPISYNTEGQVIHADRSINWSRFFVSTSNKYRLLSANSFNWCHYATTDNWPYKSAILDHDNSTRIYFFNRQSCIYDPKNGLYQHYNTRFLHKSNLRIDLDYNPTIWAMENNKAREVHLVKHVRQHFKEMRWNLVPKPTPQLNYFVEMSEADKSTLILDGNGPFIRSSFYENFTDICVSDFYGKWNTSSNSRLVPSYCGIDQEEIAIYGRFNNSQPFLLNVGLHTIPRVPPESQSFFGVNTTEDSNWTTFAKDGFSFSASTTIPIKNSTSNEFDVITLMSSYLGSPSNDYDDNYPKTYLVKYRAKVKNLRADRGLDTWERPDYLKLIAKSKETVNLNYVDDIAYLPLCETILVIFGPLYTEYPVNQFSIDTATTLGSIYSLGANEMVNAFFAHEDKLYFYHRTNFVTEHKYTCKSGDQPLVTATKVSDYSSRIGSNQLPIFREAGKIYGLTSRPLVDFQEERIFADLGIFKGTLGKPDAPDAAKYPWGSDSPAPTTRGLPWWIWLFVVIGLGLLTVMFITGFITFRRRQRKKYLAKTQRSIMPSNTNLATPATARSAVQSSATSIIGANTRRSGIGANTSSQTKSSLSTGRSNISSPEQSKSRTTQRSAMAHRSSSPNSPGKERRSTLNSSPNSPGKERRGTPKSSPNSPGKNGRSTSDSRMSSQLSPESKQKVEMKTK